MLKVLFNGQQGSVKRFKTLNYEGSQARVQIEDGSQPDVYNLYGVPGDSATLPVYYDNWDKDGWYVDSIITDKQEGSLNEFIEKEGKWFNYIKGDINQKINYDITSDKKYLIILKKLVQTIHEKNINKRVSKEYLNNLVIDKCVPFLIDQVNKDKNKQPK